MAPHRLDQCAALVAAVATIASTKIQGMAAYEVGSFPYSRNTSLGANLDLFWTIDTVLETIRIAVHAKEASGWAGLGLSEMGGMEGADIVYYETAVRCS